MDFYKKIVKCFGKESQKNKSIEELSELIRAISRNDRENVIEELVDVGIMLMQIMIIYDIDENEIDKLFEIKEKRINDLLY